MSEMDLAKRLIEALDNLADAVRSGHEVAHEPHLHEALKEADAVLAESAGLAACLLAIERGSQPAAAVMKPKYGDRR